MDKPSSSQSPSAHGKRSPPAASRLATTPPLTFSSEGSEDEADMSPRSSTDSSTTEAFRHTDSTGQLGSGPSTLTNAKSSPSTRPNTKATPKSPTAVLHPYSRSYTTNISHSPSSSPRPRSLAPLSTVHYPPPSFLTSDASPKSQPLSRALFARLSNEVPHAGLAPSGMKKKGVQKLIVPTKSFRTTFELDLTASELARR